MQCKEACHSLFSGKERKNVVKYHKMHLGHHKTVIETQL